MTLNEFLSRLTSLPMREVERQIQQGFVSLTMWNGNKVALIGPHASTTQVHEGDSVRMGQGLVNKVVDREDLK